VSALKICPQCGTEYELDQRFCPKDGSTLKSQSATADLVGAIIADRYHVLRKLGEGGMGTVYLAEHVKMGRKSAVKVMNPGMVHDADAISRFNREASNASKINHPNVCAVYDFGETSDGMIYLAMEFIEGPSLTKVIDEHGALPPLRAAEIARQVAEALGVAHDMGIVHRDLKPDNIMLTKNRDGSDCAKVVDFGIAKAANNEAQKVTKTGLVVGTPEYMSPEQLSGDKLDGRSDIYALGLVTFNMLTGKLPFPAETLQESMIMRLTDRPKQLAEMKDDVAWPPQLQSVIDRALERATDARYQTASEFGRELTGAVKVIRDSTATKQFTTLMSPPKALPTTRMSEQSKPVPPTRVSTATPHLGTPAPAAKPKSKAPMLVGVAALVVALGGGGAYFATRDKAADTPATTTKAQGDTNTSTGAVAPAINLQRELEAISALTGETTNTRQNAESALVRLGRIDAVARVADDTSFLHFRYLRGKALMNTEVADRVKAGCDSLSNIEGRLRETRWRNAVGPLLLACSSQ
jgi:eukaryotic-like serine/threonine-protein kinase